MSIMKPLAVLAIGIGIWAAPYLRSRDRSSNQPPDRAGAPLDGSGIARPLRAPQRVQRSTRELRRAYRRWRQGR